MTKTDNNYYCVILAGGMGTRMWPLSRQSRPKQFVPTEPGGKSFLQVAYERYEKIFPKENIIVVTSARHKDLCCSQLPDLPVENLLVEPYPRDTAPCAAYAAYKIYLRNPEASCFVSPVDNVVIGEEQFREELLATMDFVSKNYALAILGVHPTRPDTNYGYIQGMDGSEALKGKSPVRIKTISEKPYKDVAQLFYESGEFLWNTSFYCWSVKTVISEIARRLPLLNNLFHGWQSVLGTEGEDAFIQKAYAGIEKVRIDRGLIESNDNTWVYPGTFEWTDIGTWDSIYDFLPDAMKDEEKNLFMCEDKLSVDNHHTLVVAPDKFVAVRGLDGYVVVSTDDALLVCPRDDAKLKSLLSTIALPEFDKYR